MADGKRDAVRVGEHTTIYLRGRVWQANFQHGRKQVRQSLHTRSKKEARNKALRLERELVNGDFERPRKATTMQSGIEEYMTHLRGEGRASRTLRKYEHCFRLVRALAEERGVQLLADIDLRFVDAFRRQRADQGGHPKTVLNDTVVIRQLINFALRASCSIRTRSPAWK